MMLVVAANDRLRVRRMRWSEILAFEKLHHQVGLTRRGGTKVVDLDDVGVAELGGDLGFPAKSREGLLVRREFAR